MRRYAFALFAAAALVSVPAHAGFNELLDGLEARLGSATSIPMFGLVRFGVRVVHPQGVHDLQLAVFEEKGSFDPAQADDLMRARVGSGYKPIVRVRSRRDGEWSFIYAKPIRNLMDLIVMTNDGEDTTLIRVVADPEILAECLEDDARDVAFRWSSRPRTPVRPSRRGPPSPPSAFSRHLLP